MKYTELYNVWPSQLPTLPAPGQVQAGQSIPLTPSGEQIKIATLETALDQWLPDSPISDFINGLKALDPLKDFVHPILSDLSVQDLGVSISPTEQDSKLVVSGFYFTFDITINSPTVAGLSLTSVGLELNFCVLGDALVWNPILIADCKFLENKQTNFPGVDCALSIPLYGRSISLTIKDASQASADDMLQAAGGGATLTNAGVSGLSGASLAAFRAYADLSATPTFSCFMALSMPQEGICKWGDFTLDAIAVGFSHSTTDGSDFKVLATTTIGGMEVDAAIEYDSGSQTATLQASLGTMGLDLTDFIEKVCSEVGVKNTLPVSLPAIDVNGLSINMTKANNELTWNIDCQAALAFDGAGTSLQFKFVVVHDGTGQLSLQLQIGQYQFTLADDSDTWIFTYDRQETIKLAELITLFQIQPLYSLKGCDVSCTLDQALLVMKPKAGGAGHQILTALQLGLEDASLDNELVGLLTGSDQVGVKSVTIMGANQTWSAKDLSGVTQASWLGTSEIPAGLSFAAETTVAGNKNQMKLSPANPQDATTQGTSKPVESSQATSWFNVQKQLGPVYVSRIGAQLKGQETVALAFDGNFHLGPLTLALEDLSLQLPLKDLSNVSLGLRGMDLSYQKNPLLISGGFLSQGDSVYDGELMVKSDELMLAAIGQYAKKGGQPSLALFAALNEPPLGGPVFCYVTGLAFGGGYNSRLNMLSTAGEIQKFELIKVASGQATGLSAIDKCCKPMPGDDWLALGIIFTSFELVQSTALLTASFGKDLQLDILAQSEMSIPSASTERIAYAQVDILGSFDPAAGSLEVAGVLSDNSFIISPDCHLEGGFAYVLKESGDFVISYGGYGPDFDYQSHGYPFVPALGLLWHVDSHTSIKGSGYTAVTSAAMMAGGQLQATWNSGIFSAWFDVDVALFMQWQPFHYSGDFNMALGVRFVLKIAFVHVHFCFHVGASLQIAGPPFHGKAHIDLSVISFTVEFGPQGAQPQPLDWAGFRAMLPGEADNDAKNSALLSAKVTNGLVKDLSQTKTGGEPDWIVSGTDFCLQVQSSVPVNQPAGSGSVTIDVPATSFGILPMGEASATGALCVTITDQDGQPTPVGTASTDLLYVKPIEKNMAPAHWGTEAPTSSNVGYLPCVAGYQILSGKPPVDQTSAIDLAVLLTDAVQIAAQSPQTASANPFPKPTSWWPFS